MNRRAFTLVELLIVIAIIAILVLIALPHFLSAQVRARVARARADLRAIDTALESYAVDHGVYPLGNYYQLSTRLSAKGANRGLVLLSTPVQYLTRGLLEDPFTTVYRCGAHVDAVPLLDDDKERLWYKYSARNHRGTVGMTWENPSPRFTEWYILQSSGPDQVRHTLGSTDGGGIDEAIPFHFLSTVYDATNGIVSRGSVYRAGGTPTGPGSFAFQTIALSH